MFIKLFKNIVLILEHIVGHCHLRQSYDQKLPISEGLVPQLYMCIVVPTLQSKAVDLNSTTIAVHKI